MAIRPQPSRGRGVASRVIAWGKSSEEEWSDDGGVLEGCAAEGEVRANFFLVARSRRGVLRRGEERRGVARVEEERRKARAKVRWVSVAEKFTAEENYDARVSEVQLGDEGGSKLGTVMIAPAGREPENNRNLASLIQDTPCSD